MIKYFKNQNIMITDINNKFNEKKKHYQDVNN